LFVEPEGWNTVEIYVNGFSTSLSESVQYQALRMVPGFENCKMFRPGYAIEYDYFPPTQLQFNLETKNVSHLFFAGQINGTTGYEEAACQGLMAGINAHLKISEKEPLILQRSDAYIGVLIDDLINKGTDEPYRMFTSRAEYRTLLRQDNADLRLTSLSHKMGLATDQRLEICEKKRFEVKELTENLQKINIEPEEINTYLESVCSSPLVTKQKAAQIILRPGIDLRKMVENVVSLNDLAQQYNRDVLEQAEVQLKYSTYIEKEKLMVEKMSQLENLSIPVNFNYDQLVSLSNEARQKFKKIQPRTLGQASRISGVNPSDIQILLLFMGR
jgi:tRNA uridine 5-carboxymethylaminomethyl modification enzyme